MKKLDDNTQHFYECHERWVKRIHRDLNSPDRPDIWCHQECAQCAFYVYLKGKFGNDWGVCSNRVSVYDGQLMFEHDGCDQFVLATDSH